MLALLLATHFLCPEDAPIHRYDALTMGAVLIQLSMLLFRLETPKEAVVILIFHIVGTVMELFKTAAGSWQYPEASLLHIGAVPLFSGFMYAAVGRSEEHTSELQSLMRISYAVFCLKNKRHTLLLHIHSTYSTIHNTQY